MECPNCHKTGNAFMRIFSKRGKSGSRFCTYCNAEVKLIYNWTRIFILVAVVIVVLIILNYVLQSLGWPGITGGFAGGMAGAVIAIFMRRPPFLKIELVNKNKKKRRN
ncbi:MAG: hypothetical protein PHY08_08315 [Candidatus Cloacimonetes bacterium]|nr:hypothetical protein [Candidatus Cloacimonadota bacterium]